MKKLTSKVAHNWPQFFSVLPTGQKPAQISEILRDFVPLASLKEIYIDIIFSLLFEIRSSSTKTIGVSLNG